MTWIASMNIHPIFVHFPIAFLTLYAVLELIRFRRFLSQPQWFYVKAVLVTVGGLGTLAALYTGDMAAKLIGNDQSLRSLIHAHKNFADATTAIFGIIAASYLVLWLNRENISRFFIGRTSLMKFWQALTKVAHAFAETKFVILLALAGLICVTITGGLGGIIVYGKNADPFFGFVYKILFP